MSSIAELQQLRLHDLSINSLRVDFDIQQLRLVLAAYNEATTSYDELTLDFSGVDKLSSNFISTKLTPLGDVEIYGHEVIDTDRTPTVTFTILTGFGEPSANLSFAFETVVIR